MPRAFFAVFPPEPVEQALSDYVRTLRDELRDLSWTKPGNLHLTLRFLGDIDDRQVEAARQAADEAVRGAATFRVAFGHAGAFPSLSRPRVAWIGIEEGRAPLIGLAANLELSLIRAGLGKADKPFAPHLTLGRVRDYLPPAALPMLFERHPAPRLDFEVRTLELIESQLNPKGSIYTPLHRASLAAH